MIEVLTPEGAQTAGPSDEIGCFSVYPIPDGPFRLRCRIVGISLLTGWITF